MSEMLKKHGLDFPHYATLAKRYFRVMNYFNEKKMGLQVPIDSFTEMFLDVNRETRDSGEEHIGPGEFQTYFEVFGITYFKNAGVTLTPEFKELMGNLRIGIQNEKHLRGESSFHKKIVSKYSRDDLTELLSLETLAKVDEEVA